MEIIELRKRDIAETAKKLVRRYINFEKLLQELRKRDIPTDIVASINRDIEEVNSFSGSDKEIVKQLGKAQSRILALLEKKLKIVTRNHYRDTWLVLGMSSFGIPIGIAFGISMGNMGLLGIGIPIGMSLGIAVGMAMDKKAEKDGRQLDVEIKN